MASFDENGKYIKTNWKAGDKITATKLNKIEESIEAVNDNDISRHVEADARLDALEAKDVAHDKELTNVKNLIEDAKDAAELGDYEINSRMTFLENELNEGIEEVHNIAETVDGKIATAEANMAAMVAEVEADLEGLHAKDDELSEQLEQISSINVDYFGAIGDGINDDTEAINNCIDYVTNILKNKKKIIFSPGKTYMVDEIYPQTGNIIDFTGATVKKIPTDEGTYGVITIHNQKNVTVINPCIIGDRDIHLGTDGESGHGLRIGGCENIFIHNANISNCWGDGVYIGLVGDTLNDNINLLGEIKIKNCRRQGVSVIYCTNSFIDTIIAEDINGTEPMCALDIEPNRNFESVDNLHINHVIGRRCKNAVNVVLNTPKMNVSINKISLENCDRNIWIGNNPEENKSGEENSEITSERAITIGEIYVSKCVDRPLIQIKNHTIYYPKITINKISCDMMEFKTSGIPEIERCLVLIEATMASLIGTSIYGGVNIGEVNVNNLLSDIKTLNVRNGLISGTEIEVQNVCVSKIQVNDISKLSRPLTQANNHKNFYVDYPCQYFTYGVNSTSLMNGFNVILDNQHNDSNIDIRANLTGCVLYTDKLNFDLVFKEGTNKNNIYLDGVKQTIIDSALQIKKSQNKIYHIIKQANNDIYITTAFNGNFIENKVVSTSSRPAGVPQGAQVFDAQINKPIWYKGGGEWVDATGAVV